MKSKLSKLFVTFLFFGLICTALFPVKETQAEIRTSIGWYFEISSLPRVQDNRSINIEVGDTFYLDDTFLIMDFDTAIYKATTKKLSQVTKTITSSAPSIATVDPKSGLVTAKKAGKTKITITYKKKKYICYLTVKKEGTLVGKKSFATVNKYVNELCKYEKKSITSKNFDTLMELILKKEMEYVRLDKKGYGEYYGFYNTTSKLTNNLVVPNLNHIYPIEDKVREYSRNHETLDSLKIKTITAKASSNSITVTLNRKVTKREILQLQLDNFRQQTASQIGKESFTYIHVRDCSASVDTTGHLNLTAGSSKATITNLKPFIGDPLKLVKGKEYQVTFNDSSLYFTSK